MVAEYSIKRKKCTSETVLLVEKEGDKENTDGYSFLKF